MMVRPRPLRSPQRARLLAGLHRPAPAAGADAAGKQRLSAAANHQHPATACTSARGGFEQPVRATSNEKAAADTSGRLHAHQARIAPQRLLVAGARPMLLPWVTPLPGTHHSALAAVPSTPRRAQRPSGGGAAYCQGERGGARGYASNGGDRQARAAAGRRAGGGDRHGREAVSGEGRRVDRRAQRRGQQRDGRHRPVALHQRRLRGGGSDVGRFAAFKGHGGSMHQHRPAVRGACTAIAGWEGTTAAHGGSGPGKTHMHPNPNPTI